MTDQPTGAEAVLADLKDFQRRTARWVFQRMFLDKDPAIRFLVADEVGLGKTHIAKGVIAQVIDYLGQTGDERHDIVYVCSNAAIARQNLRKLAPEGVEPLQAERLTMLPLTELSEGDGQQTGINLLAITPGTSLDFGSNAGRFRERCLAYAFLRAHWGESVMTTPARRIFWHGVNRDNGDARLQEQERKDRPRVEATIGEFAERLAAADQSRLTQGKTTLRCLFNGLVDDFRFKWWRRHLPAAMRARRAELISAVRHVMANVGLDALRPDLVVLDEFQRFKDLLQHDPETAAAELAKQLFSYRDPVSNRETRTLLLSATPYRMYTTADEIEGDHYQDFLGTCEFLFDSRERVEWLEQRFTELRNALTAQDLRDRGEAVCGEISNELRSVMVRTERLAATPDRDGMLESMLEEVEVKPDDLRAFVRLGNLAEAVQHWEPVEYWKSAPYLVNFMEGYEFKEAVANAVEDGALTDGDGLDPGPGLLSWDDVEHLRRLDPQNGRLRWLLDELEQYRAFELLWVPPSMRYYDTGSVYESPEAVGFTKRLIFSRWRMVPKVVASLASFEAERRAFAARRHQHSDDDKRHRYTDDYRRRGGQRLAFRTSERTAATARPGEADGPRRAGAMTSFLITWPSPSLASLGDPRPQAQGIAGTVVPAAGDRAQFSELSDAATRRVQEALEPMTRAAPKGGVVDQRWYWAAPLFLDSQRYPGATDFLLASDGSYWEGEKAGEGLRAHIAEARAMLEYGAEALGRAPEDLPEVLAELALGGPAQCALRAISSVTGLAVDDQDAVRNAARIAAAFRGFFNAPEVTAVVVGMGSSESEDPHPEGDHAHYWRDVLRHSINGNLQAVLDEHLHVLRDWLGHLNLNDHASRIKAADGMGASLSEALDLRTSAFRVDVPSRAPDATGIELNPHRMRTRFAVAFGNQKLDDGGEARVGAVSTAFNSPFWPFVLASTSTGQEGLDFHLWCHAVIHWNLPSNPVDLEQREGRVHRYKGHAVRRNVAERLGPGMLKSGLAADADPWEELFAMAAAEGSGNESEMVPYWVYKGRAKIERHVPVIPFSQENAALPRLRKSLAAYRLAFGQPRQEELVEFLGEGRSEAELTRLANQLRIDLSPPELPGKEFSA